MSYLTNFQKDYIVRLARENEDLLLNMSFKDYIYPGLHSLVLSYGDRHLTRMFVLNDSDILTNTRILVDDTLAIHNHGYDFETCVLNGYLENIEFSESGIDKHDTSYYKYEYVFDSNTLQHKTQLIGQSLLRVSNVLHVGKGNYYTFKSNQLHRVMFPKVSYFAALFFEGKPQNNTKVFYTYNKIDETLPAIYSRFNGIKEIKTVLSEVLDVV